MENKFVKLASTNTVTQTNDTVEGLAEIMANELIGSVSFSRFKLVPAVADKFRMWTGTLTGAIQAFADAPAESGASTVADEEFTLIKKSVNHLVFYSTFINSEFNLSISNLKDQGLPPEFESFLATQIGEQGMDLAEDEVWNGDAALGGDPTTGDGFRALVKANVPAGQQALTAVLDPTDAADVEAFLAETVALTTAGMVNNRPKFKMFMNQIVNDAHYSALSAVAATNIPQNDSLRYENWDIEIIPNLSDRAVFIGDPDKMNIGMGVTGELVDLQVVDLYAQGTGINGARVTANWGYAAGIAGTDFALNEFTA